jgi:hypothetical protein
MRTEKCTLGPIWLASLFVVNVTTLPSILWNDSYTVTENKVLNVCVFPSVVFAICLCLAASEYRLPSDSPNTVNSSKMRSGIGNSKAMI